MRPAQYRQDSWGSDDHGHINIGIPQSGPKAQGKGDPRSPVFFKDAHVYLAHIGFRGTAKAMGYNGQHWPTTEISGTGEMHIFLIGDWGGLDGTLDTAENRPESWAKLPRPLGGSKK